LLALALPAPIQRVADTRLGPLLMLVGVPSMLVAGLLQVNWSHGLPSVAVDPQAAATVLQRTRDGYSNLEQNLEQQGGLGHLASDFLNGVSHSSHDYKYGQSYPTTQQTAPTRVPTANFPSTQPQSASAQRDPRYTTTQPTNSWGQQPTYSQQQNYSQQPTYSQPPTYAQQPTFSQSGYHPQASSPSDTRNLTQQQLYQQQKQQQLYEQQLRDQQYRQWQAQQQPSGKQQQAAAGYQQQFDTYGRPISTGYAQPTNGYSQPTNQYGQQNYNQGFAPNANTNGRY